MIERRAAQFKNWRRELVNDSSCCVIGIGGGFIGLVAGTAVLAAAGVGGSLMLSEMAAADPRFTFRLRSSCVKSRFVRSQASSTHRSAATGNRSSLPDDATRTESVDSSYHDGEPLTAPDPSNISPAD